MDNTNNGNIQVFIGSTPIFDDKNADEAKRILYIKEIISKALQIDNLNFLLGAGCSSYETKKHDNKTEDKIEKIQHGINTMIGLFGDFIRKDDLDFLGLSQVEITEYFDKNLENLLEYLISLDLVINKFDDHNKMILNNVRNKQINPIDIQNKINDIKKFIIDEIIKNADSKEVIELYKLFYQKIINKNRKNPINIFTTNYDVYNETALDRLNFLYNNGFSGTVERKFNPMLYKYMFVENMNLNKDVWEPVSYFFNLIKLHGSITWEADKNTMEIYENSNFNNKTNKVMIYPSPLKDRSTLMTPYSDLFRFLENSLYLNNSTLIVIGYSFGDDHINRVIYNALANPTFRLIIFNDSEKVEKLIQRNDKRITVIYSKNQKKDSDKKTDEAVEHVKQQDGKQDEKSKNKEYQPIHYFKYIVNNLLPSVNDDILEKERIDKIINFFKEHNLV